MKVAIFLIFAENFHIPVILYERDNFINVKGKKKKHTFISVPWNEEIITVNGANMSEAISIHK